MEEYKSNSFKSREPQKTQVEEPRKIEKVVTGNVRVKKKSGIGKFFSSFFTEDAPKIKEFVLSDVIIPSAKKAITDIVTNSIHMMMYGSDARARNVNNPVTKISYKNYSSYSNNNPGFRQPTARTTYSYDEIIFANRGEAEMVLDAMYEIIAKYGFVKVADYYDLVGTSGSYTDNNYGWPNLQSAQIVRLSNGEYTIKLPKALPID